MAFRMQTSVPDLIDISHEPKHVLDSYGPDVHRSRQLCLKLSAGAATGRTRCAFCAVVSHGLGSSWRFAERCSRTVRDTDQATTALINDLDQRGLLKDTLIVWGGEFGRTVYSQGDLTADDYGRDHHPRCFTVLMTGAGVKGGMTLGETDDYCYNIRPRSGPCARSQRHDHASDGR